LTCVPERDFLAKEVQNIIKAARSFVCDSHYMHYINIYEAIPKNISEVMFGKVNVFICVREEEGMTINLLNIS
jgi:hypothetical protein